MPRKNHEWDFDSPSEVSRHTLHKHQVYEDYIKRYIDTIVPHQGDRVVFSIIDGFCGGGIYRLADTGEICYGSPVRIIQTVRNKEKEINSKRTKPLKFIVKYFFTDNDDKAINCLKKVFEDRGISEIEGEKIHIEKGNFADMYSKIRANIQNSLNGKIGKHKAIFILDQYAYKEVPISLTNLIMSEFTKAEILLTFVPRAFLDFAGKYDPRALETTNKQLNKLGFNVSISDIREKAQELAGDHTFIHSEQLFLQESIAQTIRTTSNAKHFSKYFIQSANSSRDLWIIHLANHYKAHDVMISVQWDSANCDYSHPGYWGLPPAIIGFDSSQSDLAQQMNLEMTHFNQSSEAKTLEVLSSQIPKLLFKHYGKQTTISDLFQHITNETTCNIDLLKKSLQLSIDHDEIRISSKNTSSHRVATAAPDGAVIELFQRPIIFPVTNSS